ncbi:ABC transporter substrate-binding protein [Patescibacteria group bacterium]|nr:ABC transporter substrate-binding protein [Patescibacteria group bacterium]
MIFWKRRRLLIWLFKAYINKWRKTIFVSFLLGLLVFFLIRVGVNYIIPIIPFAQKDVIGVEGAYTVDNLPPFILSKLSSGLTSVDSTQTPQPAIAKSWQVKNNGKTYIFTLNNNIYFNDGTKLTSNDINYNFRDVTVERPNPYSIVFTLKNNYAPFLVTVSKPIFKQGYIGTGDYKISNLNLNGNFVESIDLVSVKNGNKEISYQFYPTEESLKTAFMLGEVSQIYDIKDTIFDGKDMTKFVNLQAAKSTDYSLLVTIFYNLDDKDLSDKRIREALSYAIPDTFAQGKRNYGPFVPSSWVAKGGLTTYSQDLAHAKSLIKSSPSASGSSHLSFEFKTLPQYLDVAKIIQSDWQQIGINTKIVVVDTLPSNFQIFLGEFNVPQDPDQYMLWHSSQKYNITDYKNLRIDKLLEDGRTTFDINKRRSIYQDFQKYLLDDPPATFLYFPYVYDITRKPI